MGGLGRLWGWREEYEVWGDRSLCGGKDLNKGGVADSVTYTMFWVLAVRSGS